MTLALREMCPGYVHMFFICTECMCLQTGICTHFEYVHEYICAHAEQYWHFVLCMSTVLIA